MKAESPVPQAAPVLNVVSPSICSVSLSSSVAGAILGCHPEGLKQLEMPFLLWGSQEGPLPGASGDSWPPCQTQQTLADPAARLQAREAYNARGLIFLFVFTAAKSLLNKKSDGGVKVGVCIPVARDWPLSLQSLWGVLSFVPPFPQEPSYPCFSALKPETFVLRTAGSIGLRGQKKNTFLLTLA